MFDNEINGYYQNTHTHIQRKALERKKHSRRRMRFLSSCIGGCTNYRKVKRSNVDKKYANW